MTHGRQLVAGQTQERLRDKRSPNFGKTLTLQHPKSIYTPNDYITPITPFEREPAYVCIYIYTHVCVYVYIYICHARLGSTNQLQKKSIYPKPVPTKRFKPLRYQSFKPRVKQASVSSTFLHLSFQFFKYLGLLGPLHSKLSNPKP